MCKIRSLIHAPARNGDPLQQMNHEAFYLDNRLSSRSVGGELVEGNTLPEVDHLPNSGWTNLRAVRLQATLCARLNMGPCTLICVVPAKFHWAHLEATGKPPEENPRVLTRRYPVHRIGTSRLLGRGLGGFGFSNKTITEALEFPSPEYHVYTVTSCDEPVLLPLMGGFGAVEYQR